MTTSLNRSSTAQRVDDYPTRRGTESELLQRPDPVVWPGTTSGPATSGELHQHAERGFHVVEGLLRPAEV
jgi:ectoine hydroxylase